MEDVITQVSITPEEARVGESIIVSLRIHVGRAGIQPGCRMTIECPGYLGSSRPQLLYQEQDGYVTMNISAPDTPWQAWTTHVDGAQPVRTREHYETLAVKAYRNHRAIQILWPEGVPAGTDIVLQLGAPGGGFSPGYIVGCVAPWSGFEHRFHLDVFESEDSCDSIEHHMAALQVYPLHATHAQVVRHASGRMHLLAQDIYRNPSPLVAGSVSEKTPHAWQATECGSLVSDVPTFDPRVGGLATHPCPDMAGVHGQYNLYWGDVHTHSAISCDVKRAGGDMRPSDMLRFGRDGACLDFMALTDHHFQAESDRPNGMSRDEWEETTQAVDNATVPGEFVAIAGYEHRCARGDTVVLFNTPPDYDTVSAPERAPIQALWETPEAADTLTIPHFHGPGRLPEGDWFVPPTLAAEPVMEVFSCHGRFDITRFDGMPLAPPLIKRLRSDRNAQWMLSQGYRYGVLCGSDGHKGRPGTNGLAAVFATELTREAILDALRNRRCYGTTNARIRLVFTLNGALMGSEVSGAERGTFRIEVNGTNVIRHIDVLRNGGLHKRFSPQGHDFETQWDESFDQSAHYRVTVCQTDQEMAFSSPIWVDV